MKLAFLVMLLAGNNLPAGRGKPTYIRVCSECHAADAVTSMSQDRAGWKDIVDDMVDKGATATPQQAKEIVAYLTKAFPKKSSR
jgi:cytochrome c1